MINKRALLISAVTCLLLAGLAVLNFMIHALSPVKDAANYFLQLT